MEILIILAEIFVGAVVGLYFLILRTTHTTTLLADGTVLVAGDYDFERRPAAELNDPDGTP